MYPKTKREAVERLIEKIEGALASGDLIKAVGGNPTDCPLCQYSIRYSALCITHDCATCENDFGTELGFDPEEHSPSCLSTKFGGIGLDDYDHANKKQRRAFLTALLPVLKQMLKDMR
jgi:hypothetical protein